MENRRCDKCRCEETKENRIRKNGVIRMYVSGVMNIIQKFICQSCANTNHYVNRKKSRIYNEFSLCKLESVI